MKFNRYFFILLCLILVSLTVSTAFATPISFTGTITANATLNVPSDFSDINEALSYLQDKKIGTNVIVTIQVANGTYNYTNQITVNHPDGNQIQIIGNTTSPSLCTINFSNCSNGFSVTNGNKLGLINGFMLNGSNMSANNNGILASYNSTITCGPKMILNYFYLGIIASQASSIAANNITVSNSTYGFIASGLSCIGVDNGVANNCIYGFCSQYNSFLSAKSSIANNCTYGFIAGFNSTISAPNSSVNSCSYAYNPSANTSGNVNSFINTN